MPMYDAREFGLVHRRLKAARQTSLQSNTVKTLCDGYTEQKVSAM
jgi:hypothetical protein